MGAWPSYQHLPHFMNGVLAGVHNPERLMPAVWVIGARNAKRALLRGLLQPIVFRVAINAGESILVFAGG